MLSPQLGAADIGRSTPRAAVGRTPAMRGGLSEPAPATRNPDRRAERSMPSLGRSIRNPLPQPLPRLEDHGKNTNETNPAHRYSGPASLGLRAPRKGRATAGGLAESTASGGRPTLHLLQSQPPGGSLRHPALPVRSTGLCCDVQYFEANAPQRANFREGAGANEDSYRARRPFGLLRLTSCAVSPTIKRLSVRGPRARATPIGV
jgi:hypothetical protein